jgi:hypothetical protein
MRARGTWLNDPLLHLLPGTRDVELPEELVYVDRRGHRHVVPLGTRSDGMTSPAWSWGLIGSPLTPDYRRPCFLHDFYVATQAVPSAYAHQLLRETLEEAREGGLWRARVWTFWALTRLLGPRWSAAVTEAVR